MKMDFVIFRSWFDERFLVLLKEKSSKFSSYSENQDISEIVSYAVELGNNGKRFRPFLAYISSGLHQKEAEKHFLLFASIEMLHLFALIHDDIMDDAETRHGVLCAHRAFIPHYNEHTSESIAILLGDTIFAWAYECLIDYTNQFQQFHENIFQEFKTLVSEVTHGQMLDVLSPVQLPLSEDLIVQKMTLKTARYSFVQPLRLGFTMMDGKQEDLNFAEEFGVALGIAFQLQDDLLDTLPTEQTGKSRFTDIQTKQQTLLSSYLLSSKHKDAFTAYYGKTITKKDEDTLQVLIDESGAITVLQEKINDYLVRARNAVSHRKESEQYDWNVIIDLVAHRKK